MDRAYIDKDKFIQPSQRKVLYVTLFANLLLMVMQKSLKRSWSFSGLTTMVRITMMYYAGFRSLFNNPEKDWERILARTADRPPEPSLF